jgi:hypothetical protein
MISRSLTALSIGTFVIFGLVGCTPSTAANSNQAPTIPTSSSQNITVKKATAAAAVIESIQPEPSGLLIKLNKQATASVKQIVHSPRFGASNISLSFTLQNVQVGNPSIAKLNESVGNQLIQNLEVQKHGADLIVNMTLMQPINKINLGTSGSYLGIALQYKPNKPKPTPHPVGRIPSWFFKDILTAASVEGTPVMADNYGAMLPFQSGDKTYMLKAPFNGSEEVLGFSGYFGSLSLYENYSGMLNANSASNSNLYSLVKYGLVREKKNGKWYGVKAIMVNMQNGWQLGFAKNQLIVENNHAGALGYTVYPVQGIELGAPLQQ